MEPVAKRVYLIDFVLHMKMLNQKKWYFLDSVHTDTAASPDLLISFFFAVVLAVL